MLVEPLPPVNKVFSYVQQQERQRSVLAGTVGSDAIALVDKKTSGSFSFFKASPKPGGSFKKEKLYCSHCKVTVHAFENCFKAGNAAPPKCIHCNTMGHTMDRCYKLHGYPPGHKFFGKGKTAGSFVNHVSGQPLTDSEEESDSSMALTKGLYKEIMALIKAKARARHLLLPLQIHFRRFPHKSHPCQVYLCASLSQIHFHTHQLIFLGL